MYNNHIKNDDFTINNKQINEQTFINSCICSLV